MKKLNHLSIALKASGLASESYLIQKLAREYVERASVEGLSSKFYGVARLIERDLFSWVVATEMALTTLFSKEHPKVNSEFISSQVHGCLYDWTEEYSDSIGVGDTSIPPWLFEFLEAKVFPLIKEAFSDAIDDLPADSETKAGLQDWLSRTTLEQLGAPSLSEFLDSGGENWAVAVSNLVHEMHHNILNHSIWKRFSELGNESDKYNLLDAMEEGFALTLSRAQENDNVNDVYQIFAKNMAEFIAPILRRVISSDKKNNSGNLFSQNWKNIDNHLAQIAGEEMGVKLPAEKILFLKKVFEVFKNNNDLESFTNDDILSSRNKKLLGALASAILQVWSEPDSGGEGYKWDFMTGDDEDLLINLMENLDQRSGELLKIWQDSKKDNFNKALAAVRPCVERSLLK
jgi:hypothetical protein